LDALNPFFEKKLQFLTKSPQGFVPKLFIYFFSKSTHIDDIRPHTLCANVTFFDALGLLFMLAGSKECSAMTSACEIEKIEFTLIPYYDFYVRYMGT